MYPPPPHTQAFLCIYFTQQAMVKARVDATLEALFVELRTMAEKLRKGEEVNLSRGLEIIGLIEQNVRSIPWRGDYQYVKQHIRDAAHKKGLI